jgi:hypothetical protein
MMKKKVLKTVAILLLAAGGFSSCGKGEEVSIEEKVPFTEYSLAETFCQWSNLGHDEKVIVINSNAELEQYITCTERTFPEIDFSKNTLLLVSGGAAYGIGHLSKKLLFEKDRYVLEIKIQLNNATVAEYWFISILVSKIPNDATINLKVDYVRFNS